MTAGLLLVGASGLAREVLATRISGVAGILDDDRSLHGTTISGVPVLGPIESAATHDARFLVCIGPSTGRETVVRRLRRIGVADDRFHTHIADSARVGRSSRVGRGSILLDNVVVTADAHIGDHVVIMPNCTITHDDRLEDFVTLAAGVALGGSVHIRQAAYIGMNASVRQGVDVGRKATVGMGAALLSDVPADQTWVGVPARHRGESE